MHPDKPWVTLQDIAPLQPVLHTQALGWVAAVFGIAAIVFFMIFFLLRTRRRPERQSKKRMHFAALGLSGVCALVAGTSLVVSAREMALLNSSDNQYSDQDMMALTGSPSSRMPYVTPISPSIKK